MSEIVDIITKITYLSDTKQLEQAHSQLTAIEKRIDHIVSTIRTLSTEWSKGNKENISSGQVCFIQLLENV